MVDWMYWVTAIVFTGLGWFWGVQFSKIRMIEITIDSLIQQGYLKTRGVGKDKEIVKHDE